jgi:hypothetical protein
MTAPLGLAVLALAGAWLLGGALLRGLGTSAVLAGLALAAARGGGGGLLLAALGAVAWLLGQGHHLLRHGEPAGPLGRGLEGLLPGRRRPPAHDGTGAGR